MPAGLPVKQNYVTGDVLSATDLNDLASTLNFLDPTAKGDLFPASDGATLTRLAVGANNTVLTADSTTATGLKWASSAAPFATGYNYVATNETTTSTSYVSLATAQAITVVTGTKVLIAISAFWGNGAAVAVAPLVSFSVSGATTIAAADEYSAGANIATGSNTQVQLSRTIVLAGLTAGSNTFTLRFKDIGGSTSYFQRRSISVVNLGS